MTSLSNLNDDVLDIVCAFANEADHPSASLKALSLTDKRTHALCVPHLFRTINLRFTGYTEWERGAARLRSWNPDLGRFVRSCDVRLSLRPREEDSDAKFILDLAAQLGEFLGTLTRLRRIACLISEDHIDIFEKALCARTGTLSFPLLTELCGPSSRVVAPFCPNVKRIDISRILIPQRAIAIPALLRRLVNDDSCVAEKITYLGIQYYGSLATLKAIRDCFPNLRILVLKGPFMRPFYDLLPLLASFPAALKILVLPRTAELYVGFNPPWCGTAYCGSEGEELHKRMEVEGKKAREDVTKAVFGACKHLEELWISTAIRAKVERREGSVHNIQYDLNLNWEVELAKRKRDNDW